MSAEGGIAFIGRGRWRDAGCRVVVPIALILGDLISCVLMKHALLSPLQSQIILYRTLGGSQQINQTGVDTFWLLAAICIAMSWVKGQYRKRRLIWEDGRELLAVVFWLAAANLALMLVIGNGAAAMWRVPSTWVLVLAGMLLVRHFIKTTLYRIGLYREPTVIVGTGENARQAALTLRAHKSLGYEVQAFARMGQNAVVPEVADSGLPVLEVGDGLRSFVLQMGRPHMIVAQEAEDQDLVQKILDDLTFLTSVQVIPAIRGLPLYGMEMAHVFGRELLMLRVRNNLARPHLKLFKRVLDLAASLVLLVVLAPVLVGLAVLVGRDGPVLFRHKRVGRDGRTFNCLKFRTMVVDAEAALQGYLAHHPEAREEWEQTRKIKNDPRITAVGDFLRRTSLDELPQLFNVLAGEMSLVGPRPVVEAELAYYRDQLPYYLAVRPGITGLWQVSGRNDVDYGYRVFLDSWYVKNWSLWYDVVILLKTVLVVTSRRGAY